MSDTQEPPQAVVLTDDETMALALLLAARQLDAADWLIWEDVPEIDEADMNRLEQAVADVARRVRAMRVHHERLTRTNALEIHGRVS